MQDGQLQEGWVILQKDMFPSTTPKILLPKRDQISNKRNLLFKWEKYKSPQYKKYESRRISIMVSKSEAPEYKWDSYWGFFPNNAKFHKIKYGNNGNFLTPPAKPLDSGRYIFVLSYTEGHKMGPLKIQRTSRAVRPFFVK